MDDLKFQPRNSLVLLRLTPKPEERIGNVIVPTKDAECVEAEVVRVGPGLVSADGGRSETFDLKEGQRVLVRHRQTRGPHGMVTTGWKLQYIASSLVTADGEKNPGTELWLYQEKDIIAIVAPNQAELEATARAAR